MEKPLTYIPQDCSNPLQFLADLGPTSPLILSLVYLPLRAFTHTYNCKSFLQGSPLYRPLQTTYCQRRQILSPTTCFLYVLILFQTQDPSLHPESCEPQAGSSTDSLACHLVSTPNLMAKRNELIRTLKPPFVMSLPPVHFLGIHTYPGLSMPTTLWSVLLRGCPPLRPPWDINLPCSPFRKKGCVCPPSSTNFIAVNRSGQRLEPS